MAPSESITIRGNLTGGTHAGIAARIFAAVLRPAYALGPGEVRQVLGVGADGTLVCANVTNGSFSVEARRGRPVGTIFAGASDNFLGYLSLGSGIDSVPLGSIAAGATAIDLQTLSSSGQTVQPGRNPIGQELPLTPEERQAIRHANAVFSAMVRNPDVDGNGRIDALESRFFNLQIFYFVVGGSFAGSLTPTVTMPASIRSHRIDLAARDSNLPSSVTFTGPAGSGLSNTPSTARFGSPPAVVYGGPGASVPLVPIAGQYRIGYRDQTLTFNVPDQSAAASNIVLPVPTATLNGDGTIQRLNWVYRLGAGGPALDPQAIILDVAFNIEGSGPICPGGQGAQRPYDSNQLPATATEHVLRCQNIPWTSVTQVVMSYNDIYGNAHSTSWDR